MSLEEIPYRGHKLILMQQGAGCRVFIYPVEAALAHTEIPNAIEVGERDHVLAQARKIVDGLVAPAAPKSS